MADIQELPYSSMESGQGLLPGIPDHITMTFIAPKLRWEMDNIMQIVSREWRQAICSRSVYNARVLCESTEAFLIMAYFGKRNKPVLALYSCKYGSLLQLPPIPSEVDTYQFECICLDGRVYVMVPLDCPEEISVTWTEMWVLDLAGDRQWTTWGRVEGRRPKAFKIGVLDGKIYRFRGKSRPDLGILEAGLSDFRQPMWMNVDHQMFYLPQTEVFDLHSNAQWSIITPERLSTTAASDVDVEHHLAVFSNWEREHLCSGPSTIIGRYESFYFEWRAWHSTNLAVKKSWCRRHALATQVFDTNFSIIPRRPRKTEQILFFRDKLVKVIQHSHDRQPGGVDIHAYNVEKETWELWKSLPIPPIHIDPGWVGCLDGPNSPSMHNCVLVDNIMWALGVVRYLDPCSSEVCLMSCKLPLDEEAGSDSSGWIHSTCSTVQYVVNCSVLRPIYL